MAEKVEEAVELGTALLVVVHLLLRHLPGFAVSIVVSEMARTSTRQTRIE
jgi:hypothetical protein